MISWVTGSGGETKTPKKRENVTSELEKWHRVAGKSNRQRSERLGSQGDFPNRMPSGCTKVRSKKREVSLDARNVNVDKEMRHRVNGEDADFEWIF